MRIPNTCNCDDPNCRFEEILAQSQASEDTRVTMREMHKQAMLQTVQVKPSRVNKMTKDECRAKVRQYFIVEPDLRIQHDSEREIQEPYSIGIALPEQLCGGRVRFGDGHLTGRGTSWDEAYNDLLSSLQRALDTSKEKSSELRYELDTVNRRVEWLMGVTNTITGL